MKHLTAVLAILVMILIGLACSGDETSKANESVDQANKFVEAANDSVVKAGDKLNEFQAKVKAMKTEDDLKATRDFGKELFPLYDSMNSNFTKAGEKFEEASKFKINDKNKEYLETKAKEMKLRGDYALELKKIPQILIDSNTQQEYQQAYATVATKVQQMLSDAKDLDEKATKIQKDNPTLIAQPK